MTDPVHSPIHAIMREEIARFVCSTDSDASSSIEDRMPARSVAISFRMWDTRFTPFDSVQLFREVQDAAALGEQDEVCETVGHQP